MRKNKMMKCAAAVLAVLMVLGGCSDASSSAPAGQAAPAEKVAPAAAETTAAAAEEKAEAAEEKAAAAEEKPAEAAEEKEDAAAETADAAAKEEIMAVAEEKAEAMEKIAAENREKTLAEKLVGRYTCPYGEEEVSVLELMNVHGNLYAKGGTAMAEEEGSSSFPEAYSFWAMELIPKEAGALQRTDTDEAEVGILTFSIMSNMGKYWSAPQGAILRLTEEGVTILSAEDGGKGSQGEEPAQEFTRWPDASAAVLDPGILSVNLETPALEDREAMEIPAELYGLWKEKDSESPYVLEFLRAESRTVKDRGILRVWRKQPGVEVYLCDEAFLCAPPEEADGVQESGAAQDPKDGTAGVLYAVGTRLGNADMPEGWSHNFLLKDGTLTFPALRADGAETYDSIFSGAGDFVFERAKEADIPLSALAAADETDAIRHEKTAETPGGTRPVIPQFLASKDIENNGGHFLRVGELVFFRDVSASLGGFSAVWGDFLSYPETAEGSKVMYYDQRTGETGVAFEDGGYGRLWYLDGRIYSAEPVTNEDGGIIGQTLHRCWPDGSGKEAAIESSQAWITGASESNRFLSVHQFVNDQERCDIYNGSAYPAGTFEKAEGEYFVYSGFAGEDLILVSHTNKPDRNTVWAVSPEQEEKIRLGVLPVREKQGLGGPEVTQLYTEGDDIYLGIGWYEGTGHFLNDYYVVKMKARTEDSLELVPTDSPLTIGEGDPDTPWFFLNYDDEVLLSQHDPDGEVFLSGYTSGDLIYADSPFGASLLEKGFIGEAEAMGSGAEKARILQAAEFAGGAAWVITAEAARTPEADIGWREAYTPEKMTWQRIQVNDVAISADQDYPMETILESGTR